MSCPATTPLGCNTWLVALSVCSRPSPPWRNLGCRHPELCRGHGCLCALVCVPTCLCVCLCIRVCVPCVGEGRTVSTPWGWGFGQHSLWRWGDLIQTAVFGAGSSSHAVFPVTPGGLYYCRQKVAQDLCRPSHALLSLKRVRRWPYQQAARWVR